MIRLVCVSDAHGFAKGDLIADPDRIAEILASDAEPHFVKHEVPDEPHAD